MKHKEKVTEFHHELSVLRLQSVTTRTSGRGVKSRLPQTLCVGETRRQRGRKYPPSSWTECRQPPTLFYSDIFRPKDGGGWLSTSLDAEGGGTCLPSVVGLAGLSPRSWRPTKSSFLSFQGERRSGICHFHPPGAGPESVWTQVVGKGSYGSSRFGEPFPGSDRSFKVLPINQFSRLKTLRTTQSPFGPQIYSSSSVTSSDTSLQDTTSGTQVHLAATHLCTPW